MNATSSAAATISLRVVQLLGQPAPKEIAARFDASGGTIGRAPENTLSLPDPLRQISRVHARVEWTSAGWNIRCVSHSMPIRINGFVVGPDDSLPLHEGDKVVIGSFELEAEDAFDGDASKPSVSMGAHAASPLEPVATATLPVSLAAGAAPVTDPIAAEQAMTDADSLDALFGLAGARDPLAADSPLPRLIADVSARVPSARVASAPVPSAPSHALTEPAAVDGAVARQPGSGATTGVVLSWNLPDAARAAPVDFSRAVDEGAAPPLVPRAPAPSRVGVPAADAVAIDTAHVPSPAAPLALSATADEAELLAALLAGAGLADSHGGPGKGPAAVSQLTPELMHRIGELLRVTVDGTMQLMQARAVIKREMRTEVTTIAARQNNPLKFSPDAAAALAHLLQAQPVRGFLEPVPALRDAFDDLLAHEVAFVAGTRAAVAGIVQRFDPQRLEPDVAHRGRWESLRPAARQARLWEAFVQRYAAMSREAQDDFESFFGREFVQAYEAQAGLLQHRRDESDR